MWKARLVALAFVLLGPVAAARAGETTILILGGGLGAEDQSLVEALRIYTGDVEGRLVLAGKAPAALDPRMVDQLANEARRERADIVVWGGRRGDGSPMFYVLDVAERDLRETEIEPLGAERASVAVALKVRALLFRHRAAASGAPNAEAARKPEAEAARKPEGELARRSQAEAARKPEAAGATAVAPAAPTAATLVATPAPREPPVFHRLAFSTGYAVALPSDPTWLRQALQLSAEARLGAPAEVGFAVFVDGALSTRAESTVRGFALTLADRPFGAGALLVRQASLLGAAIGPRAALHVFDVGANDDSGRTGAKQVLSLGLGGVARADLSLTTYMKVFLGVSLEVLIPKQKFNIAQQPAFDSGAMLLGVSVGVRWLIL